MKINWWEWKNVYKKTKWDWIVERGGEYKLILENVAEGIKRVAKKVVSESRGSMLEN